MLTYPHIDPIFFSIGPLKVHWYGLAYMAGIILGWFYARRLVQKNYDGPITLKHVDDVVSWVVMGIVLGYVLFYNPVYYLDNPLEIVMVWKGGMAFHGGVLGVIISVFMFCKKNKIPALNFLDVIVPVVPIGIFFGRIANFINGELFGRITDSSLGMIFPKGGPFPRHPSQIYEAILEGLLVFVLLSFVWWKKQWYKYSGSIGGTFLFGYGAARLISELFREPEASVDLLLTSLSMGQVLSIPMVLIGLYFMSKPCRYIARPFMK
jgi:phosphatidylglycerol---prolipoprotein diacylglyceryl transferase